MEKAEILEPKQTLISDLTGEDPLPEQDDSMIRVKAWPNKRKACHNKKEPSNIHEKDKCQSNNILKVIFWNSNSWNKERCEKIATEAERTDADII